MGISQQVDTREYQTTLTHLSLEHLCQSTVVHKVIYTLNDRLYGCDAIQHHHATALNQVPPLPVAMHLGGEVGQCRMLRVAQQAHGASLLGEVYRTPEYRQELAFQTLDTGSLWRQQYLFALLQGLQRHVYIGGNQQLLVLLYGYFGVNPDAPAISPRRVFDGYHQLQALRLCHLV